ncbi:VirK/YbjX family protein [Vibrio minamisatsumaniensis]|uniref:VirK/YbjX family protein n=1 Tax=Vibrio minamisatsumaniensis TaxID=2910243 RepID=UPI003D1913A5
MNVLRMGIDANSHKNTGKYKAIARFTIRALFYYSETKKMSENFSSSERKLLFKKQPNFLSKFITPYLCVDFKINKKIEIISKHYDWFEDKFTKVARLQIINETLNLLTLEINEDTYLLNLSFERNARKEGELTLSLTDAMLNKMYTISFTVFNNDIYIGGVQGAANDNGFSRTFTKAFYGLRPKSFMVESLRLLASSLSINHIYAVNESGHIYNALRYGKKAKTISLRYNELWEEHEGQQHTKCFYILPLKSTRKDLEPLKRQKRKLYRERYAWLDQYEQNLHIAISRHINASFDLAKAC